MARGWESKSVEEQIDELNRRAPQTMPPTPQEAERTSLLMQHRRIQSLIDTSKNPRFIEQQKKALAHLDAKLKALPL